MPALRAAAPSAPPALLVRCRARRCRPHARLAAPCRAYYGGDASSSGGGGDESAPLPPDSEHLRRFEASEFELVRSLGALAFRSVAPAAARLSWTVREGGDAVPDALRVGLPGPLDAGAAAAAAAAAAAGYAGGAAPVAAVTLYAARHVAAAGAPAPVLLKEHLPGAEALARRELAAYAALASPPALLLDASAAAAPPPPFAWRNEDAFEEPPLAPVLGYFEAPSPAAAADVDDVAAAANVADVASAPESLWVVQRWTGLRTLAEYPSAPQPRNVAPRWWPPVERVADAPGAARARFVATAAARAVAALAHCHARRVAHGALDSRALLLSTADDAAPGGPEVRLANFGFAVVGAAANANVSSDVDEDASGGNAAALAEAARGDCRALGLALAELAFSALSLEGPSERTSAAALSRVINDIFSRDWAAIAAFCAEEAAWAPAVALLGERSGNAGWALLAALLDDETYSADCDAVTDAARRLQDAVRVER